MKNQTHSRTRAGAFRVASLHRIKIAVLCTLIALPSGCSEIEPLPPSDGCNTGRTVIDANDPNGKALCMQQTISASIGPRRSVRLPFQITVEEDVSYCFDDDNGEHHRASLSKDGEVLVAWEADRECKVARLAPGMYELAVEHEGGGEEDPTPDAIYTQFYDRTGKRVGASEPASATTPGADVPPSLAEPLPGAEGNTDDVVLPQASKAQGSRAQGSRAQGARSQSLRALTLPAPKAGTSTFLIQANVCRDCFFANVDWPLLYVDRDGKQHRGYTGDYTGSKFNATRCKTEGVCELGSPGTDYNFTNTYFTIPDVVAPKLLIGSDLGVAGNKARRFAGASFVAVKAPESELVLTNVEDAEITNSQVARITVPRLDNDRNRFKANIGSLIITKPKEQLPIRNAELNPRTLAQLQAAPISAVDNLVRVSNPSDFRNVRGLTFKGNEAVWPLTDGKLDLRTYNFASATFSDVAFPCGNGSMFDGAAFLNTDLTRVAMRNCDLRGARIFAAKFIEVDASNADFSGNLIYLQDSIVTLNGAKLTGATFVSDGVSTFRELRMEGAQASRARFDGVSASKVIANNAILTGASFVGVDFADSSFTQSVLDFATFRRANLSGADFADSTGQGTSFFSSILTGASLQNARFTGADFKDANLRASRLPGAAICGGSVAGASLQSANLDTALIPSATKYYRLGDANVKCEAVRGRDLATTDTVTRCPDGALGACDQDARWAPRLTRPLEECELPAEECPVR
jgi:uncharacterized protein YjbI with pentapeptide repeats